MFGCLLDLPGAQCNTRLRPWPCYLEGTSELEGMRYAIESDEEACLTKNAFFSYIHALPSGLGYRWMYLKFQALYSDYVIIRSSRAS